MPLYSHLCSAGHKGTYFAKIADRDTPRLCAACGSVTERIIDAPAIRPDIEGYESPVTGQWVGSRAQRVEDLKRSNCIEAEPGLREDCLRKQKETEEARFRAVDETVDRTVAEMHAANLL